MQAEQMGCDEVAELSAALALDSVEPAERAALEAHLERCPGCRREQDELREVAAQLALLLPRQEPPPALRQRLLAEARADLAAEPAAPAEPGSTRATQPAAPVETGPAPAAGPSGQPLTPAATDTTGPASPSGQPIGPVEPDAGYTQDATDPQAPSPRPRPRSAGPVRTLPAAPARPSAWQRAQRWSPAVALASLAAAVAALIWGASLQAQLDESRQQLAAVTLQLEAVRGNYGAIVQVLASEATAVKDLEPGEAAPSAHGKVWIDTRTGEGMMMARDLPPLPEGQGYQVWLVNERGRVSPGFLRAYDGGVYYLVLRAPESLTSYQRVGVTREPLPGSPGPTTPRVVGANL